MEQETEVLDRYEHAKVVINTIQRLVKETGCTHQQATWALLYTSPFANPNELAKAIPWDAHPHQPEPDTEAMAEKVKDELMKAIAETTDTLPRFNQHWERAKQRVEERSS